jgi:uncharacterized membrane protein YkvA (DUF1232 family)
MKSLLERAFLREVTLPALSDALARYSDQVAPERIAALAVSLLAFLRNVPGALSVAARFAKDPVCGRAVAFATGEVLYYFFDEEDLLPEQEMGVLGFLDDAYLIHVFAQSLPRMYPHVDISPLGYRPPEQSSLALVRTLLPAGVTDALDRTCDNLLRVSSALFAGGVAATPATPELAPAIRINDALRLVEQRATSHERPEEVV